MRGLRSGPAGLRNPSVMPTIDTGPRAILLLALTGLLVAGCSRRAAAQPPPPAQEPPEQVLRELITRQYEAIYDLGGLPVTVTANGYSGKLLAKIYSARKNRCVQGPPLPPGVFDCSLDLMVTMWWKGRREPSEPGQHAARLKVVQDANGVWLDCMQHQQRDHICQRGGAVDQEARSLKLAGHLRDLHLHRLKVPERCAELLS